MAAADVGTLRTGFLYRNAKQHRDDPWDWTSFDELAAGTATNGIDLIPVLYGVPPVDLDRAREHAPRPGRDRLAAST